MIKEQAGQEVFDSVERLRNLSIEQRERGKIAQDSSLRTMDLRHAFLVVRAFAIYFELVNLAETNHRKRRRRATQVNHTEPQAGTIAGTFRRFRAAGIGLEQVMKALRCVYAVPVFTAHPTEVARRTVLMKRERLSKLLETLDNAPLTDETAEKVAEEIAAEITALWQSDEVRRRTPTVHFGTILTGDSFINAEDHRQRLHKEFDAKAVEMEGGAVAQVARRWGGGVPFVNVRCLSDLAGRSSHLDFRAFLPVAARYASLVAHRLAPVI